MVELVDEQCVMKRRLSRCWLIVAVCTDWMRRRKEHLLQSMTGPFPQSWSGWLPRTKCRRKRRAVMHLEKARVLQQ